MNKSKDCFKRLEGGRQNGALAVERQRHASGPNRNTEKLELVFSSFDMDEWSKPHFPNFLSYSRDYLVFVKDCFTKTCRSH